MNQSSPISLGAFELDRLIRKGGMGEVWRGVHTGESLPVAVKVMTGRHARNPRYVAAFRNEVESVARLDHPGIVVVFDHGNISSEAAAVSKGKLVAGSPYLVMELAHHGALDRVRRGLGWVELKQLLMGLLDALAHAHARGVIHRDLKPSNVLMSGPGDIRPGIKLTDFGLAHALDSERAGTRESRAGTPRYMAPELFEGRFRDYGPWTDLYALGCMAYELIARRPMFNGNTSDALRRQHLYDEPPVLGSEAIVPSGFNAWLHRLVEKKTHDRFQRAADAAWGLLSLGDPPSLHRNPKERSFNEPAGQDGDTVVSVGNASTITLLFPDPTTASFAVLHGQEGLALAHTVDMPSSGLQAWPTHVEPVIHAVTNVTTNFLSEVSEVSELATLRRQSAQVDRTDVSSVDRPLLMDRVRPPVPRSWLRGTVPEPPMSMQGVGLSLFGLRTVRLVGREAERDRLWEALLDVQSGNRARFILLEGDPGIGTSRLAQWVSERAHEVGAAHVLRSAHGPGTSAMHGLPHMFARHLQASGLSRAQLRRRLRRLLQEHWDIEQDYEWDALTELISPPPTGKQGARAKVVRFSNPAERYAVYRRYLDRLAVERPVLLWLDDVHYGSEALWFAQYLLKAQERTPSPVLIVATVQREALLARTMESHIVNQILSLEGTCRIELDRLGAVAHSELVHQLLSLSTQLAAQVEKRTDGNPLFATELVGSWVRQQQLEVGPSGFVLRPGVTPLAPSSVAELWESEVERVLEQSDVLGKSRLALEIAAVLGARVDPNEWESVCAKMGFSVTADVYYGLVRHGLAVPDGDSWCFAHELLRESLLRRIGDGEHWQRINKACAAGLEERYEHGSQGVAERIGRHLCDAGLLGDALEPLLRGARSQIRDGEFRRAVAVIDEYDRCLDALDVSTNHQRRGYGRLLRAKILRLTGQFDEALVAAETLVSIGWLQGWHKTAAESTAELGYVALEKGDLEFASQTLTQALALYRDSGDLAGLARCSTALGLVAAKSGNLMLATKVLRQALMQHERYGDRAGVAGCLYRLWQVVGQRGDLALASDLLEQALDIYENLGHALGVARCHEGLGRVALSRGELAAASDRFQEAMGLFGNLEAMNGIADCLIGLAAVARSRGDHGVAILWCERALELQESLGTGDSVKTRLEIGRTHMAASGLDKAHEEFFAVAQSAAQEGRRTILAQTHAGLLLIAGQRQMWDDWAVHLGELERLLEATQMVDYVVAQGVGQAGKCAADAGRPREACDALEIALAQWWELRDRDRAIEVREQLSRLRSVSGDGE